MPVIGLDFNSSGFDEILHDINCQAQRLKDLYNYEVTDLITFL